MNIKKFKIKNFTISVIKMDKKRLARWKEEYKIYSEKYKNDKLIPFEVREIKGLWILNWFIGIDRKKGVGIANSNLL